MNKINSFNIRVYGLLVNENQEILLVNEIFNNQKITKFPGGGLEFGEGTIECLKREFIEELDLKIEVVEHYYTTDFFQESFLNANQQIISIYYLIKNKKPINFKNINIQSSFYFYPIKKLNNKLLNLPIDKIVGKKLKHYYEFL